MSLFNKVHTVCKVIREAGFNPDARIIMFNAREEQVSRFYSQFSGVTKCGPCKAEGTPEFWVYSYAGGILKLYSTLNIDYLSPDTSEQPAPVEALALAVEFCRDHAIDTWTEDPHSRLSVSVSLRDYQTALGLSQEIQKVVKADFKVIYFQGSNWLQEDNLDINLHYKV